MSEFCKYAICKYLCKCSLGLKACTNLRNLLVPISHQLLFYKKKSIGQFLWPKKMGKNKELMTM